MAPKNRNPIKQWEITFPQIADVVSKDTFHEAFPPWEFVITAEEYHEDGGKHLHMGIKLKKGLSHAKMVKYLMAKFPNDWKRIHVSVIKDWDNWIDYCKKEDPLYFISGSLIKKKFERVDEGWATRCVLEKMEMDNYSIATKIQETIWLKVDEKIEDMWAINQPYIDKTTTFGSFWSEYRDDIFKQVEEEVLKELSYEEKRKYGTFFKESKWI